MLILCRCLLYFAAILCCARMRSLGAVLPSIKWLGKMERCLQAVQLRNQSALTTGLCDARWVQ